LSIWKLIAVLLAGGFSGKEHPYGKGGPEADKARGKLIKETFEKGGNITTI